MVSINLNKVGTTLLRIHKNTRVTKRIGFFSKIIQLSWHCLPIVVTYYVNSPLISCYSVLMSLISSSTNVSLIRILDTVEAHCIARVGALYLLTCPERWQFPFLRLYSNKWKPLTLIGRVLFLFIFHSFLSFLQARCQLFRQSTYDRLWFL